MNIIELDVIGTCLNKISYKGIKSSERSSCTKLFREVKSLLEERQELNKKVLTDYGAVLTHDGANYTFEHLEVSLREKLIKELNEAQTEALDISTLPLNFLSVESFDNIVDNGEFNTQEVIILEDYLLEKV